MSLHLEGMFRRHGTLSCATHERKHKVLKNFANHHRNGGVTWETSLLKDVVYHELSGLREHSSVLRATVGLLGPKSPPSGCWTTSGVLLEIAETFDREHSQWLVLRGSSAPARMLACGWSRAALLWWERFGTTFRSRTGASQLSTSGSTSMDSFTKLQRIRLWWRRSVFVKRFLTPGWRVLPSCCCLNEPCECKI